MIGYSGWAQSSVTGQRTDRVFSAPVSADNREGSRNVSARSGIRSGRQADRSARSIQAPDRAELELRRRRALDRVLLWNHFLVIPAMVSLRRPHRAAYWDRFGHPEQIATIHSIGFPDDLVVGRRQGGQGRAAAGEPTSFAAHLQEISIAGASDNLPRAPPLVSGDPAAVCNGAQGKSGRVTACPIFGDLKYPALISAISTTSIRLRRKAAAMQLCAVRSFNYNQNATDV